MIRILFQVQGRRPVFLNFDPGATVGNVLSTSKLSLGKDTAITVNGKAARLDATLVNGDFVCLSTAVRAAATIKCMGDKWRVHKADPDDIFPSDFHAHNIIKPETLNLYTGDIYDPRTRKYVRRLPDKGLEFLVKKLSQSKEDSIRDKCSKKLGT